MQVINHTSPPLYKYVLIAWLIQFHWLIHSFIHWKTLLAVLQACHIPNSHVRTGWQKVSHCRMLNMWSWS